MPPSDPNFSKFIKEMQSTDPALIEQRLRAAVRDGEISLKDQNGKVVDRDVLDMATFDLKFPTDWDDNPQIEMTVGTKLGDDTIVNVVGPDYDAPPSELSDEEAALLRDGIANLSVKEKADMVVEMVANAMVEGNEATFKKIIEDHDPETWDAVHDLAHDYVAEHGLKTHKNRTHAQKFRGPPGMRGYLWEGPLPEGPRKCPRCAVTWIPTNEHPGEYPGAMSRIRIGKGTTTSAGMEYASRSVEICSACGSDEAMGRGQVPIEDWPIGIGEDFYYNREVMNDRFADAVKSGRLSLVNEETGEPIDVDPDNLNVEIGDPTDTNVPVNISWDKTEKDT
jgi:hypothetical protein